MTQRIKQYQRWKAYRQRQSLLREERWISYLNGEYPKDLTWQQAAVYKRWMRYYARKRELRELALEASQTP